MNRASLLTVVLFAAVLAFSDDASGKPNVNYIMAAELGYYEPSFMGGRNIQTPNVDRMAREGMRFDYLLAGSSVCAPTRCCFLTGKHSGHTSVRNNGDARSLRPEEQTIASLLKAQGYANGGFERCIRATSKLPHHPRQGYCFPETQPYSGVAIKRPLFDSPM